MQRWKARWLWVHWWALMTLISLTWGLHPHLLPSPPRSPISAPPGGFSLCWSYAVGTLVSLCLLPQAPICGLISGLDLGPALSLWTFLVITEHDPNPDTCRLSSWLHLRPASSLWTCLMIWSLNWIWLCSPGLTYLPCWGWWTRALAPLLLGGVTAVSS